MRCHFCGGETKVTDKRDSISKGGSETRRRRECLKCKKRFTTYERVEHADLIVLKKDERRERFDSEKLKKGIVKACEKRPISIEQINQIINNIEEKLRNKAKGKEIKSKMIGELVIRALKKLDKVAYIRFASVYKDFQDVNDFKKELKQIKGGKKGK